MIGNTRGVPFHGWRVVGAAFVLAMFGMGIGFHGPSIYLHAVREARGWPVVTISMAVTVHFLTGAMVAANLPALYRRFGMPATTRAGAIGLALGVLGWALAREPWQLFAATLLSGPAWVTMGVAAINAIVAPWFARARPSALAMAYNGANIGGVVFPPLWVAAIGQLGFPLAATVIGLVMAVCVWILSGRVLSRTPAQMGQAPDGDAPGTPVASLARPDAKPLPGSLLWRDRKFLTLSAGMAIGLFAQIGLTAHLYSLLVPALGAGRAGLAMALVAAMAVAGRTSIGWFMPPSIDRRSLAVASQAVQIAGSIAFMLAAGESVPLLLLGIVLFGVGFGNGTWLPPLIAQAEFDKDDVQRVVALIVAIAQATYAFAPAVFGLLRENGPDAPGAVATPTFFVAVAIVQSIAIGAFLAGRRR